MSSFMHEDIVGRRRAERERCNDAARRSKGPLLVGYINAANYYGAPIPRHCTLSVDAVHACVSSANKRRRIKGVVFHVFKGKLDIRKKDYEQFWIASPVMMWAQMAQYSTLEELAAIGASLMSRDKRRRMATRKDQTAIVLIQLGFSMFGTTLQSPTSDNISEASTNIWMWLYVGLAAPVAEELVFRGVLMRGLKPLGRNFAIVTSALMFGLFHDDVVQGLFAFGCGLLFGFVAMEYSLVWSIVLHVFNNAVLGGVLPWLAGLFGDAGDTAYTLGLLGVSIIGLIVVLVKYGGGLRAYRRVNRSAPGTYWGWTSPAFLIFVIVNVAITILSFVTAMMGV